MGNIDKDRIVCRCKKVSEGTVIEAIKNGADTYEKVKKRQVPILMAVLLVD